MILSFFFQFALLSLQQVEAKPVEVPLNIGVGPSMFSFGGVLGSSEQNFYGIHLDLAVVIDKKTISKNKKRIPKKYRSMVKRIGEARISHLLIPESIFVTPSKEGTSVFGSTWRPIGVNQPLSLGPLQFLLGTGVLFSYAYIKEPNRTTHFVRPGIDFRAMLSITFHKNVILSGGWSYSAYIPQSLGSFGFDGDLLWNIAETFVVLNYRFPFKANI